MPVSIQEALEREDSSLVETVRAPEPPAETERVPEHASFDEIPQEVLLQIGIYDTDCAGGCG